jgi:dolichol kinase
LKSDGDFEKLHHDDDKKTTPKESQQQPAAMRMWRRPSMIMLHDELSTPQITPGRIVHLMCFCIVIVIFQVLMAKKSASSFVLSKEAKRRWQHALTGHALVQISYFLPVELCLAGLALGCLGIYYMRYHQPDVYVRVFGPLLRVDEMHSTSGQRILPGAFYFLLGTALTAAWFPMPIARYAVECLAWADPMAAWIGQSVSSASSSSLSSWWLSGKIHAKSSVAGCIACFVTATCIGYVMLIIIPIRGKQHDTSAYAPWQVVVGGLACCLAESFPFGNDNLLIPLVTAAALSMTIT